MHVVLDPSAVTKGFWTGLMSMASPYECWEKSSPGPSGVTTGRQLKEAVTLRRLEIRGSNSSGTNSLVSATRLRGNRALNSRPNTHSTSS